MGQQQLLLILLGVLVVGVALVAGINIFAASATQANRDAVTSDLMHLSTIARAHYSKPTVLAGGGNSFANFTVPAALAENGNGTYEHTSTGHGTDHIHFTGTGTSIGDDGSDPIQIEIRITIDEIKFTKKN